MKVKSNDVSFQLANNGISNLLNPTGTNTLTLIISVGTGTIDAIKTAFTAAATIEELDDSGNVTTTFIGYDKLTGLSYVPDNDTVTVNLAQSSFADKTNASISDLAAAILGG